MKMKKKMQKMEMKNSNGLVSHVEISSPVFGSCKWFQQFRPWQLLSGPITWWISLTCTRHVHR